MLTAWRASYDISVSEPSTTTGPTSDGWRTLPVADVQRALEQIKGGVRLPEGALAAVARAFQVRGPVRLEVDRTLLGSTAVALIRMSAMRVRDLPFARAHTVHLAFVLEGMVTMTPREGTPVELGPGDVSLISNWAMFDVECRDETRVLHILLSESILRERGVRVRAARFRLEGPRTLGAPLRALALALVDPAWAPSAPAIRAAERGLEDLVVAFLLEAEDSHYDHEDLRAQLRRRALDEVAARHRDAGLTPTALAGYLGVSLRHLQRGFEGTGTTIAHHITRQRARSAAALLASPGADALTVAEVARATGFGSAFELRSAFRAQYGVLPSDYRAKRSSIAPDAGDSRASQVESVAADTTLAP